MSVERVKNRAGFLHLPMSRSGFCAFPSTTEHAGCPNAGCLCDCHRKDA